MNEILSRDKVCKVTFVEDVNDLNFLVKTSNMVPHEDRGNKRQR